MAQPNDIEARVAAPETRVDDLGKQVRRSRDDSAAARLLAGGADRDVADVREQICDFRQATTSSFNAMREDLTDLRQRVDGLDEKVDHGFAEMRGKFDAAATGHQQVVELLMAVIDQQRDK